MNTNKAKGRRPLYETPDELQAAVDKYFESCKGVPVYDKHGHPVVTRSGRQCYTGETPPTVSGLALFLGYKDRRTFTRQKYRNQDFCDVVETARSRIEEFYEAALYDAETFRGALFMLRMGFGWGRDQRGEVTRPAPVRIVNRAPKKGNADPSKMQGTHIDLLN